MFVVFSTLGAACGRAMDSTDRGGWLFLFRKRACVTVFCVMCAEMQLFMADRAMAKSGSTYLVH